MAAPWINGPRWDLTWLFGSALVVPAGLIFVWGGVSSDAINLGVTALVGGPHVFATFLTTYLDPRFRREHRVALVATAVLVPAFVVAMTVHRFQWMLSFFIFAASLHVLQQNAYLADVYRRRAGDGDGAASRLIDTGVLFLSFYPIASYKLVHDDFVLGDVAILIPSVFKLELTPVAVTAAFALFLVAWIAKTIREQRRGALNGPKTALIGLTVTLAFLVPAAAGGARLELAFQTVNAWHSIQYLGIVWVILKMKKDRGEAASPFIAAVSGPGRPAWKFYGLCVLFTAGMMGAIAGLAKADPFRISSAQYYYMVVLSLLLIHYVFDGYFFFAAGRATAPDRIPLSLPKLAAEEAGRAG